MGERRDLVNRELKVLFTNRVREGQNWECRRRMAKWCESGLGYKSGLCARSAKANGNGGGNG